MADGYYFPRNEGLNPELEQALDRIEVEGIRSDQDYRDLRQALEQQTRDLSIEQAEAIRWQNSVYRLASMAFNLRQRRRNDYRIRGAVLATAGERGLSTLISENQEALARADVAASGAHSPPQFMLERCELEEVGRQCLPLYMVDGFMKWEWNEPELTVGEFTAVEAHLELCHGCALDYVVYYATALEEAAQTIGRDSTIRILRTAAKDTYHRA